MVAIRMKENNYQQVIGDIEELRLIVQYTVTVGLERNLF